MILQHSPLLLILPIRMHAMAFVIIDDVGAGAAVAIVDFSFLDFCFTLSNDH